MPAQTNVCPVCGKNDTIYKVSGVVTSGQASGTFSGPSGGVVNVGGQWGTTGSYTTLSGSTATNLAALLTPPSEPKKRAFGLITTLFYNNHSIRGVFLDYARWVAGGCAAGLFDCHCVERI
jgi:hypothetical protein